MKLGTLDLYTRFEYLIIYKDKRDLLIKKGFIPVSLGDNILRTETASLAFLAMLNYKLMEGK